ncbi:MAG: deoxyribodipyrimidine photo-lyase [Flavobacteriaceae bacterium]|nr:deoxyribodipyrimidine photo-lyase [Flavobacteriaceae bacterium]
MKDNLVIFWFRRDLRLKDNAGLFHALNENDKVLPIFIYDKNTLDKLNKSDHRVDFIEYSLKKLNDLLKKNNKSISIYYGKPVKVFSELIKKYNVTKVYSNKDYTPYSIKRDKKVEELLKVNNIDFNSYKDHVLFEKYEVVKDDNTPYKVYTPFSRKWLIKMSENKIDFFNSEKYIHKFFNEKRRFLSLKEIGFEKSVLSPLNLNLSSDTINNYEKTRNFPYVNGTSKIGLHLRFGTISTREMIVKAEASKNKTFLKELVWREFFQQILFHYPHTINKSFKPKYDRIEWLNNENQFKKWCSGQTGYPLVDAGMRELNQTGFMHNRVRMLVGSFLCKHLLIDWRWGEAYFAKKLYDYETASNVGNWQWVAGCGVDASPYFRIFNPHEQIKKFDKNLIYTKKWVPEFESVQYVEPIVIHKDARERCLLTYKKALNN